MRTVSHYSPPPKVSKGPKSSIKDSARKNKNTGIFGSEYQKTTSCLGCWLERNKWEMGLC